MTKYDVLKQQSDITHELWEDQYTHCISPTMKGEDYDSAKRYIDHDHLCDFEILCGRDTDWMFYPKKWKLKEFFRKLFHRPDKEWSQHYQCKKYLDSIGQKQDECWECCDRCIHMRYVTYLENPYGLIINIATSGLDDEYLEKMGCGIWDTDRLKENIEVNE